MHVLRVWPGRPAPLGATWDGKGVNFAVFSEHATQVDLCLFDSPFATKETHRIPLPDQTDYVWNGYLPGIKPGQLYGFRAHGPYAPEQGFRFNPHKVLLDPYAKAIGRDLTWSDAAFGYRVGDPAFDLSFDERDNAETAALAAVINPSFRWMGDQPLRTPWHKTLIYEMHVKGFTHKSPWVPREWRGKYAGVACEGSLRHLRALGITAVELMPVHHHVDERFLGERGLTNYWGYNTLGYFAPDVRFASQRDPQRTVNEFKRMVRQLHRNGFEVILDVVYNHTCEGNQLGPTLSLKGLDNTSYYRLADPPRYYKDYTGCGNTLNMQSPRVLQLIMDSLRYWVLEMHVDGFRFDLAAALARELHDVDKLGAFFDIIHQDPVLSQVKLIAEPWDVGPGGYQVGNFPVLWTEWNGKYRDCVRKFWRGDGNTASEFATRLCGSSDLYEGTGRRPYASINFVTSHDGFSLNDLVSYNHKHNEANGENNNDGDNHNISWNCGAEGPTNDPAVNARRARQKRNFIATLLFSQGVAMLRSGDEFSQTQGGNNNAYCQDNPISWIRWKLTDEEQSLLEFTQQAIQLWKSQPVLQRRKFFQGRLIRGELIRDVVWLTPLGEQMTDEDWNKHYTRCLGMRLEGQMDDEIDERGRHITGDTLLILFNSHYDMIQFMMPPHANGEHWQPLLDTATTTTARRMHAGERYPLQGHSLAVLRLSRSRRGIFKRATRKA
ncbi:glycogen debranching protein GlgX [Schlesneria paludicola]|uniref:glycogen debranching protein GlgX n=1 Tax=Schlesneria paludicola TaxID=360056 RepID=UPI00029B05B3|nr:glycogen debranching protein GlgX [Schlesneria paludicola]